MQSKIFVLLLSGVLLQTSAHECRDRVLEEANKKLVLDFYQELLGDKNLASIDKYTAENYIQHNPEVADGREGLKAAIKVWAEGKVWFQEDKLDIHHTGADGDFVWVHLKTVREGKVTSVIDIFKVKDGKIVEHWDVYQQLPNPPKNDHPLF